ncbi:proline racemase family protein [Horticoccus luteus]|uniref:Proline racemase family protein n=1 Tax=Horticoccus luteus TaxID=2862869 RepID=A0A8F9XHT0_9BACT|nr:proline racemase family protein [Horticoccus luteus]QYM79675.1 proline racemase family protein [Horticoccus luteus]
MRVIDSHTAGEPTRVVLEGGPALGDGPLADRVTRFRADFDAYRSAIVNEPRGSDTVVGALLVEPHAADCAAGVIFFNNVGYLGMCGHGTMGVVATLAHLGRLQPGTVRLDTPVGVVSGQLGEQGEVAVHNVASRRTARDVRVQVAGFGEVRGDVAWGGNWFFLADADERMGRVERGNVEALTDIAWRIRGAVNAAGYGDVDHVELSAAAEGAGVPGRNFVLCPGKAYDRSPCGTGTSAKLACLAADGKLAEGAPWVQESVTGSRFRGTYRWVDRAAGVIAPTIAGRAFITAESVLRLDAADPFCWGIKG